MKGAGKNAKGVSASGKPITIKVRRAGTIEIGRDFIDAVVFDVTCMEISSKMTRNKISPFQTEAKLRVGPMDGLFA